ncbi:unnamed protein product [Linum trigynum]|uniref:Uncharacterized protein n=1 Tax=Linum trigynum TaxID=586398 RepID=A0AAV2FBA9_9ROSI
MISSRRSLPISQIGLWGNPSSELRQSRLVTQTSTTESASFPAGITNRSRQHRECRSCRRVLCLKPQAEKCFSRAPKIGNEVRRSRGCRSSLG